MSESTIEDISEYIKHGWRMLPPQTAVCTECSKPLLECSEYAYYYCPTCQRRESQNAANERPSNIPELLLQHYCMLNEVCPINGCLNPLLRSPDKTFVICGVCGYKAKCSESKTEDTTYEAEEVVEEIKERTERYIEELQKGEFEEEDEPDKRTVMSENAIIQKMELLIEELVAEQNQENIKDISENILRLQQIIRNLREM